MTVETWLKIWLEEYVREAVKLFTLKSYKTQCEIHIKPALGAVQLTALTTPAIQKFYNRLKRGTKSTPALSPKSIKNIHAVLHAALKKATALRYIPFNPFEACELPRIEKKEIQPLRRSSNSRPSKGCTRPQV